MPLPVLAAAAAPSLGSSIMGAGMLSAGASLGGGLMSSLFNKSAREEDIEFQREVMQNAVSWRVADAKRAGLHPLFALGANVATSGGTPQFIGEPLGPALAEAGQNISNAMLRQQTADQRMKDQLDMALAVKSMQESDARIDFTRMQIRALEQANQISPSGMGIQSEPFSGIIGQAVNRPGIGVIDVQPVQVPSAKAGSPHVAAGSQPWFQENILGGRLPFLTPRGQGEHPEELLSEMSLPAYFGLLRQNEATYGPGWMKDFMLYRYLGIPPSGDYSTKFGSPVPGGSMYVPRGGVKDALERAIESGKAAGRRYYKKWNERR